MRRLNAGARNPDPANPTKPEMESVKSLHFKHNSKHRSNSYSKFSKSHPPTSKSNLSLVSIVAIALSIVFCLLFVLIGYKSPEDGPRFGIIIDGGSTGTRIHVFEYRLEGATPRFDFGPRGLESMRVSPGLSAFAGDPEEAGGSLFELVEFGKRRVPEKFWKVTEIRLMATAGLRLLDLKVQESILESCRRVLGSSGFKFHKDWASVITGSDEGLYAWVVANYALGSLGGDPLQTTGIIELGGASAQVTFVPSETMPSEFLRSLKYGNITYTLYSHSLLQLGQNVAFDSLKELIVSGGLPFASGAPINGLVIDPCTPTGYPHDTNTRNLSPSPSAQKYTTSFHARGNFSDCRAAALTLLQQKKEQCSYHHCSVGSTFIPKIDGKFLATENFFHTSKLLGLAPELMLSDLMAAGQEFCSDDWSNIRRKHPSADDEDLLPICFSSAYIVAFLHDSLKISLDDGRARAYPHLDPPDAAVAEPHWVNLVVVDDGQIKYTNKVENTPLDWAMGAFILQTTAELNANHPEWMPRFFSGEGFSNLFLVIMASIILMFVAWSFSKWRKPCLKTIYDLEKGRYIVTRISD